MALEQSNGQILKVTSTQMHLAFQNIYFPTEKLIVLYLCT